MEPFALQPRNVEGKLEILLLELRNLIGMVLNNPCDFAVISAT